MRDFFLAVNQYWIETFHVDGFRYDCVPNFWDGALGVGYAKLVYDTDLRVRQQMAGGALGRFGVADSPALIQCTEQLEDPAGVLSQSYSTATWQDRTLNAARAVAHGANGAIDSFGAALGLDGLPTEVTMNGQTFAKTALQ
jgi:1,4-alpha-glucan branching enzyme